MQLARHLIALISAAAFVLSTLTWWGHHALGDPDHHGLPSLIEAASPEGNGHAHGANLDGKSAHKHHQEGKASDLANASCCVATCVAAMPLAEPDTVCGEPLGQIGHAAEPDVLHEAAVVREDRPPRTGRMPSGPFGPAFA